MKLTVQVFIHSPPSSPLPSPPLSSRSHTIYRISIESVEIDQDPDMAGMKFGGGKGEIVGVTRLSFMNLVDLAGVCVSVSVCVCVCLCIYW